MTDEQKPEADTPDQNELDVTDRSNAAEEAGDRLTSDFVPPDGEADEDTETDARPRPPAKLERLQKILAQAGIASRRRAEELIEQGRVQVNGKIVTTLGTKADAGRDHIRVDGKLLQGAERLRYFVFNKPKGFVTTVKDPEGRPTVMQFFEKMRERLYPVGRLDYMSEGLLLVTNDGELANKLTKASSGVEKTYLVKVSGQPTEAELDLLRGGVTIERGKPGSGQVRTSPARIRQVRQGDNPWYEVVLIEGRNRELRKMFEEIGHFVEKIRRVGYGPLVLDQEPGNLRELEPDELDALRKTADGKAKTPKAKDIRRRNSLDKQLPTLRPKPSRPVPPGSGFDRKERGRKEDRRGGAYVTGEFRPKPAFGARPPYRPEEEGSRPTRDRSGAGQGEPRARRFEARPGRIGPAKFGPAKSGPPISGAPKFDAAKFGPGRQAWKKDDRSDRTSGNVPSGPRRDSRTASDRNRPGFAGKSSVGGGKSFGSKPHAPHRAGERPDFNRPTPQRREAPPAEDFAAPKPSRLKIDAIEADRPESAKPYSGRAPYRGSGPGKGFGGPKNTGAGSSRIDRRPPFAREQSQRTQFDRPGGSGRTGSGRSFQGRPARAEGSLSRPFTSSTGKPRAGGPRPSNKRSGPGDRPYRADGAGARGGPRPGSGGPVTSSRPAGKTAWKPRPGIGGGGKPPSGGRSKPTFGSKAGGFSKSGYKGKSGTGGGRPSNSRPSGPRSGGRGGNSPSRGKKRG